MMAAIDIFKTLSLSLKPNARGCTQHNSTVQRIKNKPTSVAFQSQNMCWEKFNVSCTDLTTTDIFSFFSVIYFSIHDSYLLAAFEKC